MIKLAYITATAEASIALVLCDGRIFDYLSTAEALGLFSLYCLSLVCFFAGLCFIRSA